jgi:hypothetical protein
LMSTTDTLDVTLPPGSVLDGSILGTKRAEIVRRFDEIVAFSEVERSPDTPAKRYSSGIYIRLAFAVAAHLESEILVVWGRPIAFEFTLHVGQPMDRLCFAFAVTNNLGVVVTCFWKFDEGMPFRTGRGDFGLRRDVPRFHPYHGPYAVTTRVLESRGHATLG